MKRGMKKECKVNGLIRQYTIKMTHSVTECKYFMAKQNISVSDSNDRCSHIGYRLGNIYEVEARGANYYYVMSKTSQYRVPVKGYTWNSYEITLFKFMQDFLPIGEPDVFVPPYSVIQEKLEAIESIKALKSKEKEPFFEELDRIDAKYAKELNEKELEVRKLEQDLRDNLKKKEKDYRDKHN